MARMNEDNRPIKIDVATQYIESQSAPENDRFVFSYTITITNNSNEAAQLLNRHWLITDANSRIQEVRGEGVVGEQPHLQPGESFRYTSGAVLETAVGSMHGSYEMIRDDGIRFDAPIAPFSLAIPRTLH